MLDPRDVRKNMEDDLTDMIDENVEMYVSDYIDEVEDVFVEKVYENLDLEHVLKWTIKDTIKVNTFEFDDINSHIEDRISEDILEKYKIEIKLVEK